MHENLSLNTSSHIKVMGVHAHIIQNCGNQAPSSHMGLLNTILTSCSVSTLSLRNGVER